MNRTFEQLVSAVDRANPESISEGIVLGDWWEGKIPEDREWLRGRTLMILPIGGQDAWLRTGFGFRPTFHRLDFDFVQTEEAESMLRSGRIKSCPCSGEFQWWQLAGLEVPHDIGYKLSSLVEPGTKRKITLPCGTEIFQIGDQWVAENNQTDSTPSGSISMLLLKTYGVPISFEKMEVDAEKHGREERRIKARIHNMRNLEETLRKPEQ